jgi:hypothetical protein
MQTDLSVIVDELLFGSPERRTFLLCPTEWQGPPSSPFISIGLPWLDLIESDGLVGRRLFLFSQQIPLAKRLTLLSSRVQRRRDLESWWFDLLRTAVLQCHQDDELLVTAEGSSICAAVSRAAELFAKPRLHFRPVGSRFLSAPEHVADWLKRGLELLSNPSTVSANNNVTEVLVSPMILAQSIGTDDPAQSEDTSQTSILPLADQLQLAASERAYVISLRPRGSIQKVITRHLSESVKQSAVILVASNNSGQLPTATEQLPGGWVPWIVAPNPEDFEPQEGELNAASEIVVNRYSISKPRRRRMNPVAPCNPLSEPNEWLLHWTRPTTGPWPDEMADDYLDSLILRTEAADRSSLATLLRIIVDRRIIASNTGIRGSFRVVSLTAVPLREFADRRSFRRHLHRFDFEPWGIAIRRSAIDNQARAVIYGDEKTWVDLPEHERPFFQKATSGGATNNLAEEEWRVAGDVQLSGYRRTDICIFVPSSDIAEVVSQHCEWGSVIVPNHV